MEKSHRFSLEKDYENRWNYSPSSTLCKFEYFKTCVLCFSLSIFNLCQFSLGKYLHKANSEVTKHTKKIVRLMSFKSNFDHTNQIFQDLKILTLPKINDYLTLLFMYRYHKAEHLSIIFNNLFVNNSDIHHYKTRNASNLHKKYRRTNYVNHSLASKA